MNYKLKIPIGRFCYKDNAYLCMQNEKSMKNIVWILVVIAMIAGCSEARHPLLKEAADIVHQHPDSALALISRVDTASLSGADKMEYRLLKIMTDYIVPHYDVCGLLRQAWRRLASRQDILLQGWHQKAFTRQYV